MTRSTHEDCTAHSGLNARVNIQIILSGIATMMLAVSLNVAVGLRSDVNASIEKAHGDIRMLTQKVVSLEQAIGDARTLSQKIGVLEWRLAQIEGRKGF